MNKLLLLLFPVTFLIKANAQMSVITISSPDKNITATVQVHAGTVSYKISYHNQPIIKESKLGLVREDENFSDGLTLLSASPVQTVKDHYELFAGKRRFNTYTANKRTVHLQNANGKKMDIVFQLSNDGLAFRYFFPEKTT